MTPKRILSLGAVIGCLMLVVPMPSVARPSAQRAAFEVIYDVDSGSDFDIFGYDGNKQHRILYRDTDDADPTYSPDGQRVLFTSDEDIQIMKRDGRAERKILASYYDEQQRRVLYRWPSWHPSGRSLVVTRMVSSTVVFESSILIARADGSGKKVVYSESGPSYLANPVFSPDGRWIAFVRFARPPNNFTGTGVAVHAAVSDVLVMKTDGTEVRELGTGGPSANLSPYWSAPSKLLFISARGCAGGTTLLCSGIDEIDVEAGEIRQVIPPHNDWNRDGHPDQIIDAIPAPDGERWLVAVAPFASETRQLWVWNRRTDVMDLVTDRYFSHASWLPAREARPLTNVMLEPSRSIT